MQDGVIKFNIEKWIKTDPLDEKLWHDLENARKKLFDLKLIGYDEINKIGYGNISKKTNNDLFVISGSQTGNLETLTGEHYSIIKETDFNKNSVVCEGPILPSSESITHAACYSANKRVNAVIHIHSIYLWKKLLENKILSTPESAEYGSIELSNAIKEIAKKSSLEKPEIIVMEGHKEGIIFFGESLEETLELIIETYNSYK